MMGAGAYGSAMASNYNTRPRAAEVMVSGESASGRSARIVERPVAAGAHPGGPRREAGLHQDACAGNDFVVIDGVTQAVDLSTAQLKRIADRRRGIGATRSWCSHRPMTPTPIFATPSTTPTVPALANAEMAHGV